MPISHAVRESRSVLSAALSRRKSARSLWQHSLLVDPPWGGDQLGGTWTWTWTAASRPLHALTGCRGIPNPAPGIGTSPRVTAMPGSQQPVQSPAAFSPVRGSPAARGGSSGAGRNRRGAGLAPPGGNPCVSNRIKPIIPPTILTYSSSPGSQTPDPDSLSLNSNELTLRSTRTTP